MSAWPRHDHGPVESLAQLGLTRRGIRPLWANVTNVHHFEGMDTATYTAHPFYLQKRAFAELAALVAEGWTVRVEPDGQHLKVTIS